MRKFLLFCVPIVGFFCLATGVSGESLRTPHFQENILHIAPDDSSDFVPIVKPSGGTPIVEVLSRQGEWEEVRLNYRFKYNGSRDPRVCKMSLFEGTFTGFRKISEKQPE